MFEIFTDIRHAIRGFVKRPGLAIISVIALGLGIGLTTAMFSIVNGVVLRGLPIEDPQELVAINRVNPSEGPNRLAGRYHDYIDLAERQTTMDGIAAMSITPFNVSPAEGTPEFLNGASVTANMFSLMATQPFIGRAFTEAEEVVGAAPVVVVGHQFWQDRLGGSRDIVGQTVRINGLQTTVIGVMPDGFEFPFNQQLWQPLQVNHLELPRGQGPLVFMFGRVRDGVSITQTQADLGRIMTQLGEEYPETNEGMSMLVGPYTREIIGFQVSSLLFTMLGAVGFVLIIACANVANLLLARASLRTKEVAIRTAMGASRFRVIRQLLIEAGVIAAVGAVAGIGIAQFGVGWFNRTLASLPGTLPFWFDITIDGPVLVFVLLLTIGAALLSGMIPAIRASGAGVGAVLKDESRSSSGLRIGRITRVLVVAEVALSCALLVGAGLLIKSVTNLTGVDYQFATEQMFTASISLPEADYPDGASQTQFFIDVVAALEAQPGVEAAAIGTDLPVIGFGNGRIALEGETYLGDRDYPSVRLASVGPKYFRALETPVLEGRDFSSLDNAEGLPVAIVNQQFVERYYPDESPIGRRVQIRGALQAGRDNVLDDTWFTIVGIAPDLYLDADAFVLSPAAMYVPFSQRTTSTSAILVRTRGDALELTSAVRETVANIDGNLPISSISTLGAAIRSGQSFFTIFGVMFTIFGGVALFLATVGLYGVLSFSVNQRTHEVGLRVALGATPGRVVRLILRQGFIQLGIGVGLGLVFAFGLGRMISLLLYDVTPTDPIVYAGIVTVLVGTGIVACLLPARRATRVDPMIAMRAE